MFFSNLESRKVMPRAKTTIRSPIKFTSSPSPSFWLYVGLKKKNLKVVDIKNMVHNADKDISFENSEEKKHSQNLYRF